jgi:hypothetical protein
LPSRLQLPMGADGCHVHTSTLLRIAADSCPNHSCCVVGNVDALARVPYKCGNVYVVPIDPDRTDQICVPEYHRAWHLYVGLSDYRRTRYNRRGVVNCQKLRSSIVCLGGNRIMKIAGWYASRLRPTQLAGLAVLVAAAAGFATQAPAQTPKVRGAHEGMAARETTDDLGITVPIAPVDFPARRYPASNEFPTGPAIGERLPEFELPNHNGEIVDFHADRGDSKAIVVFYRSASW